MFQTRTVRLRYTLLILLLVCRWARAKQSQESPGTAVQEQLIGEKSPETPPEDIEIVSRDGKRLAWRDKHGEKWVLVVDGKKTGAEYDEIEWILFSPDGKHLAHRAKAEKRWTMVLDGLSSPEARPEFYKELGNPRFSPDGQHLAYRAKKDKWLTVLDGKEGPVYDEVGEPMFSPDSKHLVYPAKREKRWIVVEDGEELGPEMKDVWRGELRLKKESLVTGLPWAYFHLEEGPIYFGRVDKSWSLIMAGAAGPKFDAVTWPVFWGSDEHHYSYAGAVLKGKWTGQKAAGQVIVDSEAGPVYEGETTATPGQAGSPFAGTGSPLAAALAAGVAAALAYTTDDVGYASGMRLSEGALTSFRARSFGVSSPSVSPDGKHLAYAARRGKNDYVVVRDGDVSRSFESIPCNPVFGPDGRLVYVGVDGDKLVLTVDGEPIDEFVWEGVDDCSMIRFTEGGHFVYAAAEGGHRYDDGYTSRAKRRVFLDGKAGKEYDAKAVRNLQTLLTGPELHLAYEVYNDKYHDDASFVVVDGLEGKPYDAVMPYSLKFSDETGVTYTARQGRKFFRVTQSFH